MGSDVSLGATGSGTSLDGGTLRNTSAITTNRDITLNSGGGTLQTTASLGEGTSQGQGSLTKTGNGVLTLSANNRRRHPQ